MNFKERNRLVTVGIFVFIGLAIVLAAIFTLGGKESKFAKNIVANVVFDNVEGLKPGNNIWLSGMKIGTVRDFQFVEGNKIKLTLKIESEFQEFVKKDCVARIGTDGLIGNKIVIIEGGSQSAAAIDNHDYIKSVANADMMSMLNHMLQQNGENLTAITQNLKSITEDITNEKGLAGVLIKSPQLVNEVRGMIGSAQHAISGINTASKDIQTFTHKFNNPHTSLNKILTDTAIYPSLNYSIYNIENISNKLISASDDINSATVKLRSDKNAIGTLLNDDKAGADIKSALQNTKNASDKLDDNMEALRYNYFFRRGFKKMNKEKKREETPKREADNTNDE